MPVLQLGNDKSHLQSPVAEVYVADRRIAVITDNSLDRLPDHCRTEMTYVEGFCNIRPAVVNDDLAGLFRLLHAELLFLLHLQKP